MGAIRLDCGHEHITNAHVVVGDKRLCWAACGDRPRFVVVSTWAANSAIRRRLAEADVPMNVAADIEQIICEVGGDWGDNL